MMTLVELERRVKVLEQELRLLNHAILQMKGADVIPGFGPVGTFKDDPTFAEAERERLRYRQSLDEGTQTAPSASPSSGGKTAPKKHKRPARPGAPGGEKVTVVVNTASGAKKQKVTPRTSDGRARH
jgi:hypothetical protein